MADKKPLKANLTLTGNLDSLAEFEDADYIDIDDGGTGQVSLTSGEILIGNGVSPITTLARGNLLAGSNKIIINDGASATGVVLGQNVTIDINEASIDINNTTGQIALARVLQKSPGTVYALFADSLISGVVPVADEQGNTTYDGGS